MATRSYSPKADNQALVRAYLLWQLNQRGPPRGFARRPCKGGASEGSRASQDARLQPEAVGSTARATEPAQSVAARSPDVGGWKSGAAQLLALRLAPRLDLSSRSPRPAVCRPTSRIVRLLEALWGVGRGAALHESEGDPTAPRASAPQRLTPWT